MNNNSIRLRLVCHRYTIVAIALTLFLGGLRMAVSQSLPEPITPPTTPAEADDLLNTLYPEENTPALPPAENAEKRPWKLTLRASLSAEYDSNILISPQNRESDFLFTAGPGFTFGIGDFENQRGSFILLDYSADVIRFADHTSEDAVEQHADLGMQYQLASFTIGLQFHFLDLAGPDVDVGDRTKRRLYQTALLTRYDISDKTYLDTDFRDDISDYETQLSSMEWTVRSSLNYEWSPKVTAGIGAAAGQLDVQKSSAQTFERAFAQATYSAGEKLAFECDGGLEIRQFGSGSQRVNPVFNVSATYRPFDATELKLDAYRRVENSSSFVGQDYVVTGVNVELHRDMLERFRLVFAAGYQSAAYHTDTNMDSSGEASRTDRYFYIRPSLQFNIRDGCRLELFYLFRENDSTVERYGFNDAQAGVEITLSY